MVGNILGSRYEVLERIGTGGMSLVYRARDITLNRLVAVKILKHQWAEDEEVVRRFEQEARAAASLVDRHIVQVYDVGRDEPDIHFMVMELVAGETLRAKIDREGPLAPEEAMRIADQVAQGLEAAHLRKLVHRDIKPQNVLITPEGEVKVTDFGIAYAATTGTLVNTGSLLGTVQYLSPEQARGKLIGPQSDLYSLGVVLFEMLSGRLPFESDSAIGVAIKHLQDEPPRLDQLRPGIPAAVADIVERALSKDPAERYQSARALRQDIDRYLNPPPALVANQPEPVLTPERRGAKASNGSQSKKRRRWLPWAIVIAVILLLAGGTVYAYQRWINAPLVSVPNVHGKSLHQARSLLAARTLSWTVDGHGYSETVAKGDVLSERPSAGSRVKSGQSVVLILSAGPLPVHVPNVSHEEVSAAKAYLRTMGLKVKVHHISSTLPAGEVVRQHPHGGRIVGQGSTVGLWVSNGAPKASGTMPDLIGMTPSQAASELARDNMTVGTPTQINSTEPPNTIVDQSPAPFSGLSGVSSVSVAISIGPTPISSSELESKTRIPITIASSARPHSLLKIVVTDAAGNEEIYYQEVNPNDAVDWTVSWYGQYAEAAISLNGTLLGTRRLVPNATSPAPSSSPSPSASPSASPSPSAPPSSAGKAAGT